MKSMTGYGCGSAEEGGVRATVEIRTLNHRHLDVHVSAPAGWMAAATTVDRLVRRRVRRGRVEVLVTAEGGAVDAARLAAVAPTYRALERVRGELGLSAPIDLGAVFVAVAASGVGGGAGTRGTSAVARATEAALAQVEEMRTTEGAALRACLEEALGEIERRVVELVAAARALRDALPGRLQSRMELLETAMGTRPIDAERLRQEVALLLDRSDVTEEGDRLACHVENLRGAIGGGEPAGRRADFLAQEILRETGTLAAKAQDPVVSRLAAELRAGAGQLREQLQNVE